MSLNLQPWAPYLGIIEIILAVTLTVLVLLQTKGSNLGGLLGGGSDYGSGFRTRRGVEQTIHRITIYTSVVFFIVTLLTFMAWGQTT